MSEGFNIHGTYSAQRSSGYLFTVDDHSQNDKDDSRISWEISNTANNSDNSEIKGLSKGFLARTADPNTYDLQDRSTKSLGIVYLSFNQSQKTFYLRIHKNDEPITQYIELIKTSDTLTYITAEE
ncbi:hypothetical protein KPC83_04645 [Collinsella sp. zg1085]|uniref:hypothetical protein n=1 Tax=Collinsella sp. zg1085 TaxID=2844380 RepID=UPI001C0BA1F4|nr:hypothetical protein [Collinsella sp. zg1085]QWT17139.1 hypothetical protein KPC83_04645 [Collinsella sp. zg1085]